MDWPTPLLGGLQAASKMEKGHAEVIQLQKPCMTNSMPCSIRNAGRLQFADIPSLTKRWQAANHRVRMGKTGIDQIDSLHKQGPGTCLASERRFPRKQMIARLQHADSNRHRFSRFGCTVRAHAEASLSSAPPEFTHLRDANVCLTSVRPHPAVKAFCLKKIA